MAWLALIAALQESRWDFKPGSWAEFGTVSLRAPDATLHVYREDGGPRPKPFLDGLKESSRRAEEWQGRPCAVVEYKDETRLVTTWAVAGLKIPARDMSSGDGLVAVPEDVVRAIRVEKVRGRIRASRLDVLDLSERVDAAGRSFDCVVEISSWVDQSDTSSILRSKRRWLSAEVPGHVVRQERQCTAHPAAVAHAYTVRDELAAFHVER